MWCLCILFLVTTLLISRELSPDWKTVYRVNKVLHNFKCLVNLM
nr:MAG TPA: hypothetical protein [Caudoviricetes sp.]